MHLFLDTAPAVVSAPVSPDGTTEVFRRAERLVERICTRDRWFPRLGILAGRDDGMRTAVGDGIVAFASIVGAISGDAAGLLIGRDLAQQVWQHRRIADIISGDLDGPTFLRVLVDPEVNLAPDATFRTAMIAGVPLTFALDLDACAVDQQIQQPRGATVGDVDGQELLAAAQRAKVGHCPAQPDQV